MGVHGYIPEIHEILYLYILMTILKYWEGHQVGHLNNHLIAKYCHTISYLSGYGYSYHYIGTS